MSSILLSIKPEYVQKIFSGSKKYEFRKRLANKSVDRIIIYSTSPIMEIVGEVEVIGTVSASPTALWDNSKEAAGISRNKYREYFKGCKKAYAYQLGKVIEYNPTKKLEDYNINFPPQSFIYLSTDKLNGKDLHS